MPNIILYSEYRFYIKGQSVNPPINWLDLEILATFEKDSPEANITISEVIFVNQEAVMIRNEIAGGLTGATDGIYQGVPFRIELANSSSIYNAFEGFLNLADGYSEISPVKVKCKISKIAGINTFGERIQGLTYNLLETRGIFSASDYINCPYVVQREFEFIEFALLSITTFMLVKELAETVRRLSIDIANIVAHTTGGVTGPVAAVIYAVAVAIINVVYAVLLVIYLIQLIKELISYLFVPTRIHKGIPIRTALEKACNYLGYNFQSSIPDMDVVYLPSKSKPGTIDISQFNPPLAQLFGAFGRGLPNSGDFGYTVAEMFQIAHMCFDAKTTIRKINGVDTVCVESLNNYAFWIPTGGYTLPDVLDEEKSWNTEDLKANRLITFSLDLADYWTLENFRGNSYEITTDAITCADERLKLINGFDEVRIPCALPTRKNSLTDFEKALKVLAQIADSIISFFGGNSSLANYITNRVGCMILSTHNIQVPKLIKYVGGTLPSNYRDVWSAKHLEDNYHVRKSFVRDNYNNQYRKFDEREIPFGFVGFLSLVNFGACTTQSGAGAEIKSFKWATARDKAIANYRVKEIHSRNLTETFREEGDNFEGSI